MGSGTKTPSQTGESTATQLPSFLQQDPDISHTFRSQSGNPGCVAPPCSAHASGVRTVQFVSVATCDGHRWWRRLARIRVANPEWDEADVAVFGSLDLPAEVLLIAAGPVDGTHAAFGGWAEKDGGAIRLRRLRAVAPNQTARPDRLARVWAAKASDEETPAGGFAHQRTVGPIAASTDGLRVGLGIRLTPTEDKEYEEDREPRPIHPTERTMDEGSRGRGVRVAAGEARKRPALCA